ncbi:MAG TPA: hypothetical protein LFW21_04180 [Rickettsia endosymbiont of Pyrocoelia pectoralis]|nr:hypothetical protein [Rickettsia endosymbiont of Pyrocoelia pectoralis]
MLRNFNPDDSKEVSITISKGNNFQQTNDDLDVKELKLEAGAEIKFTHYRKNYKFVNSQSSDSNSNDNDIVINDLHSFVEAAKNIKPSDNYYQDWQGEDNLGHLALFIQQNQGCDDIPILG